jgi:hypothetical protein
VAGAVIRNQHPQLLINRVCRDVNLTGLSGVRMHYDIGDCLGNREANILELLSGESRRARIGGYCATDHPDCLWRC